MKFKPHVYCGKCNNAHFAYKEVLENSQVVMCMWRNVINNSQFENVERGMGDGGGGWGW